MQAVTPPSDRPGSLRFKVTPKKILAILFANSLIALFLYAVGAEFSTSAFLFNFVISQCIGISIATCVIVTVNAIKTANLYLQIIAVVAAMLVGATAGILVGHGTIAYFFSVDIAAVSFIHPRAFLSGLLNALLFGSIVTYVFLSIQRITNERIRRLEAEKSAVLSEIKLLQSQMEPHFLFNTLSTVIGLIDQDPHKAKRMLESFTLFLRATLALSRSESIPLAKEVEALRHYLDVFTVRMGNRLRYTIDIRDALLDFPLPPLLLQPLVENAIKHGLEPSTAGGDLLIQVVRQGTFVRLAVEDSGIGVRESGAGHGSGISNIKKRLDLLYHGQAKLRLEENKPSGVKVIIEIPYENH